MYGDVTEVTAENPIKVYPDGNKWCALWGEDLQSGETGFGDTPEEAIAALCEVVEMPDVSDLNQWIKKPL